MLKTYRKKSAFSLVEVILSSAVFALLVSGLAGAYVYIQEASVLAGNRVRANFLADEGLEAARNLRDEDFNNLADGTHGLATSSNQWNFSGTEDLTAIFTRQIVISSIDTDRKSVTSTVTWQQNAGRNGSVSLTTLFTNWVTK